MCAVTVGGDVLTVYKLCANLLKNNLSKFHAVRYEGNSWICTLLLVKAAPVQ